MAVREGLRRGVATRTSLRLRGPKTRVIDVGGRTRHPRPQRLPLPRHPRRPQLQPGAALGRRALARGCHAHAARAGAAHAAAAVGTRGRRLVEFQFAERRLPTLARLNAAAPDTPVFILHLYDRALLNRAALRAVGYTKDTPEPPGGIIERDHAAIRPACSSPIRTRLDPLQDASPGPEAPARAPDQLDAPLHARAEPPRRHSVIDAGGGFQNYPDDYAVIEELAQPRRADRAHRLQPLHAAAEGGARRLRELGGERADRTRATTSTGSTAPARCWSTPPRTSRTSGCRVPTCRRGWRRSCDEVVRLLAEKRWPFRLHATYDETISRALDVFEEVNREVPISGLRWFFDHCETIATGTSSGSRRSAAASPSSTGWRFRASTSSTATGKDGRGAPPPIRRCWRWACRSAPEPTPRASPATTPGSRSRGSSRQDGRRHDPLPRGEPPQPGGGAAAVHGRERLVLGEEDKKGSIAAESSPMQWYCRPTTFRCRGRHQGDRVGPDDHGWQGRPQRRRVCEARSRSSAREPRVVTGGNLRRVSALLIVRSHDTQRGVWACVGSRGLCAPRGIDLGRWLRLLRLLSGRCPQSVLLASKLTRR